jgi:hypothetical protein
MAKIQPTSLSPARQVPHTKRLEINEGSPSTSSRTSPRYHNASWLNNLMLLYQTKTSLGTFAGRLLSPLSEDPPFHILRVRHMLQHTHHLALSVIISMLVTLAKKPALWRQSRHNRDTKHSVFLMRIQGSSYFIISLILLASAIEGPTPSWMGSVWHATHPARGAVYRLRAH